MIDIISSAIIHCSIANQSKLITPREATKITKVCNEYAKVVQSVWHKPRAILKIALVDEFTKEYQSYVKPNWIGFHATGRVIQVNVKNWYLLGNKDVVYPLTHEVAEAIVMPNPSADGTGEVADPVGSDFFMLNEFKVSQFLTPSGTEYQ